MMSGQLMALKDLKEQLKLSKEQHMPIMVSNKSSNSSLEKQKIIAGHNDVDTQPNIDSQIACNVVDHIFNYIELCLKEDKSKIKLNLFTKSFIRGILTNSVRSGINDFIMNMNDKEANALLNDIHKELNKRRLDGE